MEYNLIEYLKGFLENCIEDTPEDKEVKEKQIYIDLLNYILLLEEGGLSDERNIN